MAGRCGKEINGKHQHDEEIANRAQDYLAGAEGTVGQVLGDTAVLFPLR